jgi:tRNA (adenine57-N1/adenine58-N1)-methyltransferase
LAALRHTNQVTRLLDAFYPHHFAFIDVCEVMLRYYKAVHERFRPVDRMVAHTGYLIFARPVLLEETADDGQPTTDEEIVDDGQRATDEEEIIDNL